MHHHGQKGMDARSEHAARWQQSCDIFKTERGKLSQNLRPSAIWAAAGGYIWCVTNFVPRRLIAPGFQDARCKMRFFSRCDS